MTEYESITRDRRALVASLRANKFEKGLRRLLTDLYPDNAHFIYELLQNAEDAHAKEVIFTLEPHRLVVEHDGSDLFSLKDVESITSLGESTKGDDPTAIGKFGVGFKAVFAYTATPEVHSGDYSFTIVDLYVPEPLQADSRPGATRFVFPFNEPSKPAEAAVAEVEEGLTDLGENTLLFLTSIESVLFSFPDGRSGLIERVEIEDGVIRIRSEFEGVTSESTWLRLLGRTRVTNQSLESSPNEKNVTVAAAFALEPRGSDTPPSTSRGKQTPSGALAYTIAPVPQGQVCIYFPAVKETSGLRFHIHAPFASTVARDSVQNTAENEPLIDAIGHLVADSLPSLKKRGLLTDGLLASLPNRLDNLTPRYRRIASSIEKAFFDHDITPVHRGGNAPAGNLASSPQAFRNSLGPDDRALIEASGATTWNDQRPLTWIATRTGLAGQFLSGLQVEEFGWAELSEVLEDFHDALTYEDEDEDYADAANVWREWLKSKDTVALRKLFVLFGEISASLPASLCDMPLVRVGKIKLKHVVGAEAYLPTSRRVTGKDIVPVELAPFEDDADLEESSKLRRFYHRQGVARWDDAAKIARRLGAYRDKANDITLDGVTDKHLADVKAFAEFLSSDPGKAKLFKDVPFLLTVSESPACQLPEHQTGDRSVGVPLVWRPPNEVLIDLPFIDTGLAEIAETIGRFELWPGYQDVPEFADFASAVGCLASPRILRYSTPWGHTPRNPKFNTAWAFEGNESSHRVFEDFYLPELVAAVDGEGRRLLSRIWSLLRGMDVKYARAHYRRIKNSKTHWFDSLLLQQVRDTPWIPDRDGSLRTPAAMSIADLPDGLEPPLDGDLLMAAGFGQDEAMDRALDEAEETTAIVEGFASREHKKLAIKLSSLMSEGELRSLVEDLAEQTFPQDASDAPDRRASVAIAGSADAPEKKSQLRERLVRVEGSEQQKRARAYLRQRYTDGESVHCQACHGSMPFKVKGQDYFEAVYFVRSATKDHHQARLALCPTCAAMYQHARRTDDSALLERLATADIDPGLGRMVIAVEMADREFELWFVEKHAIDIQAVLGGAASKDP